MVQINMRVFKIILLLIITVFSVSQCSPVSSLRLEHRKISENDLGLSLDSAESTERPEQLENTYDQRQNGSENYRVQIDGLVLVVAPVEALLLAGGIPDNFSGILAPSGSTEKPLNKPQGNQDVSTPTPHPTDDQKPEKLFEPKKIGHRGQLKLVSFLAPLLKQMGHL